jgi:hypothetical protein
MGRVGDLWHMREFDGARRINRMMNPLLAVHIAAGSVALASMFVPMVTHKGGITHRRAGWVFVGAMAIVSVTAFVLAGSRFLFDPTPAGRTGGLFLLFVGLLTASSVSTGVRVLSFKNRTGAHLHWWDTGVPALLAIASVGLGIYGLVLGETLFIGFSVIGALNGFGALRYWLRAPSSRTHWWFEHMTSMLGGCIAATTAFMVNTADNFGLWPLAAWLAPSLIGGPAIGIWTAYYRKKFSGNLKKETVMNRTSGIAREVAALVVLALVVFSPAAVSLLAQGQAAAARQVPQGFPDLVGALKSTPGCLGVETARTSSGKQVIFAWFENKKAVLNWYYSDTHRGAMQMFAPGGSSGRVPLEQIADDSGPIMAIASLTLVDKPQVDGVQLPVSQIAIELYAPLPGGLAAGGRFAPSSLKVPGLIEAPATSR